MSVARRLRALAVSAAAMLTVLVLGSAVPAHAAYPTSSFSETWGQTYTRGTLTWYNRNVGVAGTERVTAGNCRGTSAYAFTSWDSLLGSGITLPACREPGWPTGNVDFSFAIPANIAGGAAYVRVCLYADTYRGPGTELVCDRYNHP